MQVGRGPAASELAMKKTRVEKDFIVAQVENKPNTVCRTELSVSVRMPFIRPPELILRSPSNCPLLEKSR